MSTHPGTLASQASPPPAPASSFSASPPARSLPVRLVIAILTSAVARILGGAVLVTASASGVQWLLRHWRLAPDVPLTASAGAIHALGAGAIVLTALGVYALFVRLTERRWPAELRPAAAPLELSAGVVLGAVLCSLVVGVLWVMGVYRVESAASSDAWGALIFRAGVSGLVVATLEETLFRAILFRITQQRLGTWWAVGVSSLFFGLAHIMNPNATALGALGLALQAGVLLGGAYALTQRLWLAIGLHAAWNFMQQAVYGGALSGTEVKSIVKAELVGPAWLSGGGFGIEGSIVATIVCGSVGFAILAWLASRGELKARSWPARPVEAPAASCPA